MPIYIYIFFLIQAVTKRYTPKRDSSHSTFKVRLIVGCNALNKTHQTTVLTMHITTKTNLNFVPFLSFHFVFLINTSQIGSLLYIVGQIVS